MSINLPPEKEAIFKAQAHAQGLTLEQWLVEIADQYVQRTESIAHLQRTSPDEWLRQFRSWAEGHDRMTPTLSDQALLRENIYPDRD